MAENQLAVARATGRAFFGNIELMRQWNGSHGSVYVPITESTQPNPWLNVPNRDLTTSAGIDLTLVNPAMMTRELAELAAVEHGVRFRLVSRRPVNPKNLADPWQGVALFQLEDGAEELFEAVENHDFGTTYRYIAPLRIRTSCLECHQDYAMGEIRGGIGVDLPAALFEPSAVAAMQTITFLHLVIALLGWVAIGGLGVVRYRRGRLLAAKNAELARLAATDALTGMLNRRALLNLIAAETVQAEKDGRPVALVLCDIDHFKRVNDTFGHLTGDAVLREVARRITGAVRPYDHAGRVGGEEFLIACSCRTTRDALEIAERLRKAVACQPVDLGGSGKLPVTISIGVSLLLPGKDDVKAAFSAADRALYRAKNTGRNRVESSVSNCDHEASASSVCAHERQAM